MGYADGIREGINSGKTAITAHFHKTGNQTFVSDDSQTAYQKYQAYLASNNTGESYSSAVGCYQNYYSHSHSSSCYTVYHTHNDSCYYVDPYHDYGYTRTEVRPGDWCDVCNYCGSQWGAGTFQCVHEYRVLNCSRDTSAHLTCGKSAGTWYNKNCSYSNGQILEIKLVLE